AVHVYETLSRILWIGGRHIEKNSAIFVPRLYSFWEDSLMSKNNLSRRDMLKLMGMASVATVVPAFGRSVAHAATAVSERGLRFAAYQAATLTVMLPGNELSADEIKAFEDANPGVKINQIEPDQTRFFAMVAGGNPPDIVRTQAPGVPQL